MRSWVRAPGGPSFLMSHRLGFAPGSTAHETHENFGLVIQQHFQARLLILRGLVAMTGPCHWQIRPRPGFNSRRGSFFSTQVFILLTKAAVNCAKHSDNVAMNLWVYNYRFLRHAGIIYVNPFSCKRFIKYSSGIIS